MKSLFKPGGVVANFMGIVDSDMRNAHPGCRLQIYGRHGVASNLLKDYFDDHDVLYALVLDKDNGNSSHCAKSYAKEVTRADVKKLFIGLLYRGSSGIRYE